MRRRGSFAYAVDEDIRNDSSVISWSDSRWKVAGIEMSEIPDGIPVFSQMARHHHIPKVSERLLVLWGFGR